MKGKFINNLCQIAIVAVGLIVALFFPSNAEAFCIVAAVLVPFVLGHAGAIYLGNKDKSQYPPIEEAPPTVVPGFVPENKPIEEPPK